jgi:PAS domain S-box-containing protein
VRKEFEDQVSKWTGRVQFFSLRARLLLLGALTLLPAFGFVLYSSLEQRREAADQAKENALHLLQLAALDQKHMVGAARQQLLTLAQLPIVRDPALAGQCTRAFARLRELHHHYNNLGVADRQGWIYCSGAPLTAPVNIADRDYFRAALATRDFSISDYQIGRIIKKGVVAFGFPVLNDAGTVLGVAFVSIDLATWFKESGAGTSFPPEASLLLINDRGTILARHPDAEQWMGKAMPDKPLINAITAGAQTGRVEDIGLDGVQRVYVFTQVHTTPAGHVYMVAGIPSADLYTDANRLFLGGLVGIVLAAALVGAAAWIGGSRLILSPVLALTHAAKQLGQGDLRARTHLPHSGDELGRLALSFDQMAMSLQEKDELLTTVGTMAKVGGWEFDTRTRKGTWTDEVARIHDMDPSEATSVEIGLTFFQGESRKKMEAAVKAAMERGEPYDLELEMITTKGNRKWVRTIGQPVTEHGQVVKVWGSFQDISEHKRAAEEIHRLNAGLERKVIERTAELQAANRELESFSYSVSHDLRAPLRAIDGFSQAVIEDYADKLGDQGRNYLNRVRTATQHMGHLIDDLIKLARVARAEMQHEAVDLSTLAGSVLASLQASEPARKVDWHIEPDLATSGDANLLRVVLDNLLGNAWKFTGKQACARIEFGVLQQASPVMDEVDRVGNKPSKTGGPAYFVRDNGVGFDMAYAGKLFGAFQRLHAMSEFPGTGIGLATVQRIIHRHGGRVWAEGAAGKGATFYFSL